MKRIALLLLSLVTALYFLAHALRNHWSGAYWLEAFAEAAMIGALADWFAVVALFRHPLSLPIPHTAIIPRNKDRIADTLGQFIHQNFLSADLVREKLAPLDLTERALRWLDGPGRLNRVADQLTRTLLAALKGISDEKVLAMTQRWVEELTADPRTIASGLSSFGKAVIAAKHFDPLLDRTLNYMSTLLSTHSEYLRQQLHHEMPWYIPRFVQDKLYRTVVQRVDTFFRAICADPDHPARGELKAYLGQLCDELLKSEELQQRIALSMRTILQDPAINGFSRQLWAQLLDHLSREIDVPDSLLNRSAFSLLDHGRALLQEDGELRSRLNRRFVEILCQLAQNHGEYAAHFISSTMKTWNAATLSEKVEEQIGQDLQFVRVNGTLVGGMVGLFLAVLERYLA